MIILNFLIGYGVKLIDSLVTSMLASMLASVLASMSQIDVLDP